MPPPFPSPSHGRRISRVSSGTASRQQHRTLLALGARAPLAQGDLKGSRPPSRIIRPIRDKVDCRAQPPRRAIAAASRQQEPESLMSNRFVVEANRRVVGIAVRVAGGFRFFSSDPDYAGLEAQTFPRARAISRRIAAIARA